MSGEHIEFLGAPRLSYVDSVAIPASMQTRLGAQILPLAAQNPDLSAVIPLGEGHTAFAARLLLAETAQVSIDASYYIWTNDATGLMLLDALRRAAERGVRVRLLLDDNGTPDLDPELAELNAHPNVEVRLFNPFGMRRARRVSLLLDFARLNRRMHNKTFSVDGVVTILGGRNIGDIYFAHSEGVNYFDLDVVALGEAAVDVADDFDLYWASPSSVPVELILPQPEESEVLAASVAAVDQTKSWREYSKSAEDSRLMDMVWNGARDFIWANVRFVSDDPAKGQGPVADEGLMLKRLEAMLGDPASSVDLVSAYFVPGDNLTGILADWAESGVRVRVMTNAQEATDVLPVHSGYLKYRDALLDGGVEVYELKAERRSEQDNRDFADVLDQFGLIGSSKISLHAKAFVIDNKTVFIGSFNFDPRSFRLNTELGFLIENAELARRLFVGLGKDLQFQTYRVRRTDSGGTEWLERTPDGGKSRYDTEPGTSAFSRALVTFIGWLPIIWLL